MGSLCSAPAQDNLYKDVNAAVLADPAPAGALDATLLDRYKSLLEEGSVVLSRLQKFESSMDLVRDALKTHDPEVEARAYESTRRTASILLEYVSYRDCLVAAMPQLLDLANQGASAPFGISPAVQAANEARFADPPTLQALRLLAKLLVQVCKIDICFFRNSIVSDISFFKRFCTTRRIEQDDPLIQLVNNKTITLTIAVPAPTLAMIAKGLTGGTSAESGLANENAECPAECDCACETGDCGCGCDPSCPCHGVKRPKWFFAALHEYRAPAEVVAKRVAVLLNLIKFLVVKPETAEELSSQRRECLVSATIALNSLYFDYETQFGGAAAEDALGAFSASLSLDFEALLAAVGPSTSEGGLIKNCLSDAARKAAPTRPAQAAPITR